MSGSQRQDAAFQNIFGADRKAPVRQYPEQYAARPAVPAFRDDSYRTKSLQGGHPNLPGTPDGQRYPPPGHTSVTTLEQQERYVNSIPPQRPQRVPSEGYLHSAPIARQPYDRAQSLQSNVQRPNFQRLGTGGRTASTINTQQANMQSFDPQDIRSVHSRAQRQPQHDLPITKGSQQAPDHSQSIIAPSLGSMRANDYGKDYNSSSVGRTIMEESVSDGRSPATYLDVDSGPTRIPAPSRSFSSSTQATKVPDRSFSMSSTSSKAYPDRSFSFSGTASTIVEKRPSFTSPKSQHGHSGSGQAIYTTSKRSPMVYPALLSRVADAFRRKINPSERTKDGLTYKDAFLGSDAVDAIAYIIRTTDRNLALLLGRSLDAQKFFHDVTYDHRLRDSPSEVYQFKENLAAGFSETEGSPQESLSTSNSVKDRKRPSRAPTIDSLDSTLLDPSVSGSLRENHHEFEDDLPNGVFTLLTECYSPTCTRDRLCYSIACPRRLEQQARLNMRPTPGLKRAESRGSLNDLADGPQENKLWINSVSQDIVDSVDESEKKRQEVICEAIYTERDFVKDLEYLRDFWIKPLRSSNCIPEARREKFIRTVFGNVLEVHLVNSRLAEALTHRQQAQAVVHEVGDIFLEFIPHFEPFIRYGAQQLYAKFEFEREKSTNPLFAKFVEETERLKESRKLELNGYLTKPTTRLARYPLLLEAIQKYTKDSNNDKTNLPKAVTAIKVFLSRVNAESGKAENKFNLMQLQTQLVNKPGEPDPNLKLTDDNRLLIFKGPLKKKNVGNANASTDNSSDVQVFLFDHVLLMVKAKLMNKRETLKVHRKPIPLELLVIQRTEEDIREAQKTQLTTKRPSSSLLPGGGKSSIGIPGKASDGTKGYSITFQHLGRRGYAITLYATTQISRRKWLEQIELQQKVLRDRHNVFQPVIVCEKYFSGNNKVQCVIPYDGGRKLIYGTDNGIYVSDRRPNSTSRATPVRVLAIQGATQIDIIEEYGILLVLQEKTLVSFSMEALDINDNNITNKRPRKVSSHTSFFKAGVCLGRVLVCVVKSSVLSSTIKVFEPVDHKGLGKKQPAFRKLLAGGNDLKVFKEFYIPTESSSIHFLKSKLCVGCAKGFEVVSLENLETQSLLDPADSSLDFFQKRENVKPVAIYRLNGEFLLCYDEFAFFVDRNGWRARPSWVIQWEGICEATALHYPYILAFEPSFVEIYHVETGALVQIVPGNHIRLVHEGRGKMGEGGEILITSDSHDIGAADSIVAALSLSEGLMSPT